MSVPKEISNNISKEMINKKFNYYIYVKPTAKVLKRLQDLNFSGVDSLDLRDHYFYLHPNKVSSRYSDIPTSSQITPEDKVLKLLMAPKIDIKSIYDELF